MPSPLRLDVVSDIACPWCAVGLAALDLALQTLAAEGVHAERHCQPFELNPGLAAEGLDTLPYLQAKYGLSEAQVRQNQALLRERGAAVGFAFGERARVWPTFDAHRLLHWAALPGQPEGAPWQLQRSLLQAYHGKGLSPADAQVLLACVRDAGLDPVAAAELLAGDAHAEAVRAAQTHWQRAGIRAVPAVVVNARHLIAGAHSPQDYAQALRTLAAG